MELTILNTSFVPIGVIDTFTSLIWKDSYRGFGDFQLIASPTTTNILTQVNSGPYLTLADSEHVMVIENLQIDSDAVDGNKVTVKGRSLETILGRRIIWNPTTLTGDFQTAILKLLNENAINPTVVDRKITKLTFEASTDPFITGSTLPVEKQYFGENLYNVITDLCLAQEVGYKITLNKSGNLVFKLYAGLDRSYGQTDRTTVVFSPQFDNLINSTYTANDLSSKTVVLTVWKGQGDMGDGIAVPETVRIIVDGLAGVGSDLTRRETFLDASSITKPDPGGIFTDTDYPTAMSAKITAYIAQIRQLGADILAKSTTVENFEGEIDTNPNGIYVYNRDFFIGDIVQVEDEYAHQTKSQVTEVIHSQDEKGPRIYPTFTAVSYAVL
jgi:Siphovirus ReqiPepy6 Gp37-like protein